MNNICICGNQAPSIPGMKFHLSQETVNYYEKKGMSICKVCHQGYFKQKKDSSNPKKKNEERYNRINRHVLTLYHQTKAEYAKNIVSSQKMMRGKPECIAGSGIYFATNPSDTNHKAHNRGVILVAEVKVGKVKTIGKEGDKSLTFTSLLNQGFDSVLVPRDGGYEYVVYNSDQVSKIKIYRA